MSKRKCEYVVTACPISINHKTMKPSGGWVFVGDDLFYLGYGKILEDGVEYRILESVYPGESKITKHKIKEIINAGPRDARTKSRSTRS